VASIASYKKVKVEGGAVSSGGRKHSSSSGECIGFMSLCFPGCFAVLQTRRYEGAGADLDVGDACGPGRLVVWVG